MNSERSLTNQIALVERKLEIRRERTRRHWHEMHAQVERSTGWWPLLAAGAALVLGIAAGRRPRSVTDSAPRKGGVVATLVALGATALRVALSPAGRALWATLRTGRPR